MKALLTTLFALALAVFAIACGGDDGDSDDSSGKPLTKQEFIAQADAICEDGDAAIEEEALDLGTDVDQETLVTQVIVPGTRDQVDQIRELTPPETDGETISEFLDTFDRGLDELENDPSQLAKPETILEARQIAGDYGFKSCNTGGSRNAQESGASVGETGPKGEFIAQADQICAETSRETQKTVNEVTGGKQPTAAQLSEVAELTASGIEDQVSGIRGLEVPEGDEDEVDAILDAAESGAEELRNDPDQLNADQPNAQLQEANDLAVEYGLTICGS